VRCWRWLSRPTRPNCWIRPLASFERRRRRLADLLEQGGLQAADAARFAAVLVASSEGAVVLARAEQSLGPFDLVAEQLVDQVRTLSHAAKAPRPRR